MAHSSPTRRYILKAAACACCLGPIAGGFAASAADVDEAGLPTILELGVDPMQRIGATVWVAQIAQDVWLHTSTHPVGDFIYPANGLILTRPDGAILIDTGWTPEQARILAQWIVNERKTKLRLAVATHFHNDRTGGVEALEKLGVRTFAHPLTTRLAREHDLPTPEPLIGFDQGASRLDEGCELFFPGAGHTPDNIVVHVSDARILYGGCFLKSATSADLGNLSDAVVSDWTASIDKMRARYGDPKIVVPGHGAIAGDAVGRTLDLLDAKIPRSWRNGETRSHL